MAGLVFTPSHRGGSGSPLVCLHGFTATWRAWELILPALERRHDVLAPTLVGHAGGPPLEGPVTDRLLADALERQMDDAGFETAHIAGNSLGGFVALQLAERGRARSVTAFAPAGGWAVDDSVSHETLGYFATMHPQVKAAAAFADSIAATPHGRRQAMEMIATNYEHIPDELIAHQIAGAGACEAPPMIEYALAAGYGLDAQRITCPVRIAWGTGDRILPWPAAAARFRTEWTPHAEWVELEGAGHCPQLDVPLETSEMILGLTSAIDAVARA